MHSLFRVHSHSNAVILMEFTSHSTRYILVLCVIAIVSEINFYFQFAVYFMLGISVYPQGGPRQYLILNGKSLINFFSYL